MKKKIVKLTEKDLYNIINESVKNILFEEDYIKYHKYRSPYDDNADGNGVTQPVKKGVSLFDIRARIPKLIFTEPTGVLHGNLQINSVFCGKIKDMVKAIRISSA